MTDGPCFRAFLPLLHHRRIIGFLLIGVLLLSCTASPFRSSRARGVYHRVKSGETLFAIARAYHINVQELAEVNNISRPDDIAVGSAVFIPDASHVIDDILVESRLQAAPEGAGSGGIPAAATKADTPPAAARKETPKTGTPPEGAKRQERESARAAAKDRAALSRAAEQDMASRRASEKAPPGEDANRLAKLREEGGGAGEIQFDRKRFVWPVNGKVVAKFGPESVTTDFSGRKVETAKIMNNGIKIAAGAGTPVIAAGAGKVVYSMTLERFGNTIIIEHDDDFKTVYYDLGKRLVETLQKVKKGDPIGYLGSGSAVKSEAFMHFEIRHRNKPRNPLFFLP